MDLLPQVQRTITNWQMIKSREKLLVAVSGGPDSVALLDILWRLAQKLQLELVVVHLNHALRGGTADQDQKFVEELACKLSLPFFTEKVAVASMAQERGLTVEEAGRAARYDFFGRVALNVGAQKVALGHNADDQAETVLMRLIRGTGARGLGGMKPIGEHSGLRVVRPIIECTRDQIEAYCRWAGLDPRIDITNNQLLYFRNRIRHRYLPLLQEENPALRRSLAQTAQILRSEDEYLDCEAQKLCQGWQEGEIPIADLEVHPALARRALRLAISRWYGESWGFEHLESILALRYEDESRLSLPGGREAVRLGNVLILGAPPSVSVPSFHYLLPCPGTAWIPEWDLKLVIWLTRDYEPGPGREYFLLEELKLPLAVRTRRRGDRFQPRGVPGTKKLKDWFGDAKLPKSSRERIPLLVDREGILWVAARRRSGRALPKEGAELLAVKLEK